MWRLHSHKKKIYLFKHLNFTVDRCHHQRLWLGMKVFAREQLSAFFKWLKRNKILFVKCENLIVYKRN